MGGIDKPAPKLTDAQYRARLIELGSIKLPDPHTVWVVEDPSTCFPFYKDRSDVDNICYQIPVAHFEKYPFGLHHLMTAHILFYREYEPAVEDAIERLAKAGRRCRFCLGVAHPATGCQYTPTFLVCGTCIRPYQDVLNKIPKAGLGAYLERWTAAKSSKKLKERFPDAKGFYESAALFMGQDNRRFHADGQAK